MSFRISLLNEGTDCRTLREALEIGTPSQIFREKLILDAELVLWDQEKEKIAEFNKLSTYIKKEEMYLLQPFGTTLIYFIVIPIKRRI